MLPVTLLFRWFGPHRYLGQIVAASMGILAAALTTAAALRAGYERRAALFAGLIVALMPSQILWSSVVLRDSTVWASAALVAVSVARLRGPQTQKSDCLSIVGVVVAVFLLCFSRQQTAVAVAYAAAVAIVFVVPRSKRLVLAVVSSLVLAVTLSVGGLGLGGIGLIREAAPDLGSTRTFLSLDARSAIVNQSAPTTKGSAAQPAPTSTAVPTAGAADKISAGADVACPKVIAGRASGALGIAQRRLGQNNDAACFASKGREFGVDNSVGANLRQLPDGILGMVALPTLWGAQGNQQFAAAVENIPWIVLYGLAAVGIWRRRRSLAAIGYPILVVGSIVAIGALTQGNVGTAFRHRGQILFAVALLAAEPLATTTRSVQRFIRRRRTPAQS